MCVSVSVGVYVRCVSVCVWCDNWSVCVCVCGVGVCGV